MVNGIITQGVSNNAALVPPPAMKWQAEWWLPDPDVIPVAVGEDIYHSQVTKHRHADDLQQPEAKLLF